MPSGEWRVVAWVLCVALRVWPMSCRMSMVRGSVCIVNLFRRVEGTCLRVVIQGEGMAQFMQNEHGQGFFLKSVKFLIGFVHQSQCTFTEKVIMMHMVTERTVFRTHRLCQQILITLLSS